MLVRTFSINDKREVSTFLLACQRLGVLRRIQHFRTPEYISFRQPGSSGKRRAFLESGVNLHHQSTDVFSPYSLCLLFADLKAVRLELFADFL